MQACCRGWYALHIAGTSDAGWIKVNQKLKWVALQTKDLLELFVLPGLVIFLPWSWSYLVFRTLAHLPWLYRADSESALKAAQRVIGVDDPKVWLFRRKLLTLVDHADLYLARTRSSKWMAKNIDVEGSWPDETSPALLCTFHWGAGMWSLRHAKHAGMKAHSLVAPMSKKNFVGRPVLWAYVKMRVQTVSKELGFEALDVSGTLRPVLTALRAKEQVLAAIDVPSDAVTATVPIEMLETTLQMPKGLLRIAGDNGIPVTVFTMGLDPNTGRRRLCLVAIPIEDDVVALAHSVFACFDKSIRQDSWAWHFWAQFDRFTLPQSKSC